MTRTGIAVAGSILGPSVITALAFIGNATVQPTSATGSSGRLGPTPARQPSAPPPPRVLKR
jgi:hypothetical protein